MKKHIKAFLLAYVILNSELLLGLVFGLDTICHDSFMNSSNPANCPLTIFSNIDSLGIGQILIIPMSIVFALLSSVFFKWRDTTGLKRVCAIIALILMVSILVCTAIYFFFLGKN